MMDVATGTPRLGWIGLGKMGAPMCLHLLKAGHSVDVFDTLTSAMTAVEAEGATVAASARAVAESAAIIFVSLPNDGALRSLILGEHGIVSALKPGKIIIETSTVSPTVSQQVAEALTAGGVDYLRAPISGSTATAASAKLTVLASGPKPRIGASNLSWVLLLFAASTSALPRKPVT